MRLQICVVALLVGACASDAHMVRRIKNGGTVKYEYSQDDAKELIRNYCGKRGFQIVEENDVTESGGAYAVSSGKFTTIHSINHDVSYIHFKCRTDD